MKNVLKPIPFLLAATMAFSCSHPSQAPSLKERLSQVSSQGKFFYGHQDDLVYGHAWKVEDIEDDPLDRSDVKDVCGEYPAVVGFDLGGIEMGDDKNLDSVDFVLIKRAAIAHAKRGGIITLSWHPRNPLTGGDSWDVSSDKVVESILDGGENHDLFMGWLSSVADFLSEIVDENGNPIEFIFRPWHENLGSWFWWGGKLCSADQYKELYKITHDYLSVAREMKNIVWAYSPNSGLTKESLAQRYPGDELVDVIGVDHYEYMQMEDKPLDERITLARIFYGKTLESDLKIMKEFAASHGGKLIAVSETGFEGLKDPYWWTKTLLPAIKGSGISYVLTWRNAHDKLGHFYAPYKGIEKQKAEDFVAFYNDESTVFLSQGRKTDKSKKK